MRPGGRLVVSTHHPTADWLRQGGSYFTIEAIEETWNQEWSVGYWRLPLTATCAEFTKAGFLIERLVEPQPGTEMAERFPDEYDKLKRQPGFITFRLVRPLPYSVECTTPHPLCRYGAVSEASVIRSYLVISDTEFSRIDLGLLDLR